MRRIIGRAVDANNKLISDARISVYKTGGSNLVALYSDDAYTVAVANPMRSDHLGFFDAYTKDFAPLDYDILDPLTGSGRRFVRALHEHRPILRVGKSVLQSINTAVWTTVTFDQEIFDDPNLHDDANNSRLTVNASGKYMAIGTLGFASDSNGFRAGQIWKNGVYNSDVVSLNAVSGNISTAPFIEIMALTSADYLELKAYQSSGLWLAVNIGTYFSLAFLGE